MQNSETNNSYRYSFWCIQQQTAFENIVGTEDLETKNTYRYSFWCIQQQTAFENIVGTEEIARKEQFLLFPQCLLLNQIIVLSLVHIFDVISFFATELEEPKISIWGKWLKQILNLNVRLWNKDVFKSF